MATAVHPDKTIRVKYIQFFGAKILTFSIQRHSRLQLAESTRITATSQEARQPFMPMTFMNTDR